VRTVKLTWRVVIDRDNELELETEVVLGDETEPDVARSAGYEAHRFIIEMLAGIADSAGTS
jgi:hypothetical protein